MKRFLDKLRYVKVTDVLSFFVLIAAIPYSLIIKKKRRHIWLICENGTEARDNGYWLYQYICNNHPETDVIFVIAKDSPDYKKVEMLGKETISPRGFKHWAYYLAAENNISSQKDGKPNAAVCYLMEVYGIWKNKRIFLQHGIIHNDVEFLHYQNTKMSMFICGAEPECRYVKEHFGYPEGAVRYLGLARFDGLYNFHSERIILIMPTWRKYIATPGKMAHKYDSRKAFCQTSYFCAWDEFFKDQDLQRNLKKYNCQIVFYPHRNMQRFLSAFSIQSPYIKFADWHQYDVQALLKKACLLITDYSSVAMDFAYMYKPLLYYQFDLEEFRKTQYKKGYFDYDKDGFGPTCRSYQEVKSKLIEAIQNGFTNDEIYVSRAKSFFTLHDARNCERIYNAIVTS